VEGVGVKVIDVVLEDAFDAEALLPEWRRSEGSVSSSSEVRPKLAGAAPSRGARGASGSLDFIIAGCHALTTRGGEQGKDPLNVTAERAILNASPSDATKAD